MPKEIKYYTITEEDYGFIKTYHNEFALREQKKENKTMYKDQIPNEVNDILRKNNCALIGGKYSAQSAYFIENMTNIFNEIRQLPEPINRNPVVKFVSYTHAFDDKKNVKASVAINFHDTMPAICFSFTYPDIYVEAVTELFNDINTTLGE